MSLAIALFKFGHIAALLVWCAGLIALPIMLAQHAHGDGQDRYTRIRKFTHYSYTHLVTPAAVIAVAAGIVLIFLRETFVPWFFAKMAFVGALVVLHALIGGVVIRMGEEKGDVIAPRPYLPVALVVAVIVAILALVLAKPVISPGSAPEWLQSPRNESLLVDEVPT